MKNVLLKDALVEIKKSFGRFMSIFAIIILGVAFFSGIKISAPNMNITADKYYDDYNLMDIMIMSTLGLTDDDVAEISKIIEIDGIYPTYSKEVLLRKDKTERVLKVHGIPLDKVNSNDKNYMNRPRLIEGRLPEKSGECVIENSKLKSLGVTIGSKIKLYSGDSDPLSDSLKNSEYTVVGLVESPYYVSFEKGSSSIGDGKLSSYIMVPEEDFVMDVYTEIFLTVDNAKDLMSYDEEYEDKIKVVVDKLEDIGLNRADIRYDEVITEAETKLADAKKEYQEEKAKAEKELRDAANKIEKSKVDLANGEKELNKKEKEFYNSIATSEKQLKDGEQKLLSGEKELNTQYEAFLQNKENAEIEFAKADEQIRNGENQLKDLQGAINNIKAILEDENTPNNQKEILENQLKSFEEQYNTGKSKLDQSKIELQNNKNALIQGEAKLEASKREIEKSKKELEANKRKLESGKIEAIAQFKKARADINEGKVKLQDGIKEYEEGKAKADKEFAKAEIKINDAEDKIKEIKEPKWYVLDRNANYGFVDYGSSAKSLDAISKVFPIFFFLVAALICLTTMTRMVDEQRVNIGTMKALGYGEGSIMFKYLFYAATASILGSIVGVSIGFTLFPTVIFDAYTNMTYSLPPLVKTFNVGYFIMATLAAVLTTTLAVFFACHKELKEVPAALMRPKAPKEGKRILLERIPFIWNRLNFIQKVTSRNIFRYKKRFLMTVIGISGCTALLVTGFGLRDSISAIVEKQYTDVFKYDGILNYKSELGANDENKAINKISKDERITEYKNIKTVSVDSYNKDIKKPVTVFVPENLDNINDFLGLQDRTTGEKFSLNDDGVIVNEKLAKMLEVKIGDTIYLDNEDDEKFPVKINGIVENYVGQYVYMTPKCYKNLYNEDIKFNQILIRIKHMSLKSEEKLAKDLMNVSNISAVGFNTNAKGSFEAMIANLNQVILLIIVSAGALAFVVLYNLTNVNVSERIREIATIKVLGFYDNEVSSYVFRENFILTLIGALVGLGLGVMLHSFIMVTVEPDNIMFGRNIELMSFVYSSIFTIIFAVMVNIFMYFKLKKIHMVESLKSVD